MEDDRNVYKVLVGEPKGKGSLGDQGIDERMGSEWILGRWAGGLWIGISWLRIGAGG
jgi:hypothetical protein